MGNYDLLDYVFLSSIIFAIPLLVISMLAVGKHVSELQYQKIARLNGIRSIQGWKNLRTHANRVLFAGAFLVTSILGLTDVDIITRTWIGRALFLFVLFEFLLSSILDWRAELKQLEILMHYEQINNIPAIRIGLHKLNNKLQLLFGYTTEVEMSKEQKESLEVIQEEIIVTVKAIQIDFRAMDPSYRLQTQQLPLHEPNKEQH